MEAVEAENILTWCHLFHDVIYFNNKTEKEKIKYILETKGIGGEGMCKMAKEKDDSKQAGVRG